MDKRHPVHWRSFVSRRLIALTAVLTGAAVLARFAHSHWILELLSHFTRHYFLGALVLAGLLLWLGRPYWALFAGALAVIHFPLLDGYPGVAARPCTSAAATDTLRVMQFNIMRDNRKAPAFYPWLQERQGLPDILILFEATNRLEESLHNLDEAGYEHRLAAFREDPFGIAVATRLKEVTLSLEAIGDPELPSVSIRGRTQAEAIPFILVATHPPPPLTAEVAAARNSQFAALAEFMAGEAGSGRILVGDLNVTPWSPWFRNLLDGAGLRNAQFGRGHLGTFPAFGLPSFFALPIDHTLVSPDVQVLSRTVGPGIRLGSDHRPVETRLLLSRCD